MSDITTKLQSLSRWLRQLATHEPEPECKASHVECADDCVVAADDIHRLRMKVSGKDADIASLRDRLRDTAQILIAEVGATGPADAEEVARKAVSQIARLRAELARVAEPARVIAAHAADAMAAKDMVIGALLDTLRQWQYAENNDDRDELANARTNRDAALEGK